MFLEILEGIVPIDLEKIGKGRRADRRAKDFNFKSMPRSFAAGVTLRGGLGARKPPDHCTGSDRVT